MKKYYFIGAGGAVGALLRFELKSSPNLFQSPGQLINLALTTFSTFMFEDFVLLQNNRILSAIVYVLATLVLSFLAFYGGFVISSAFSS